MLLPAMQSSLASEPVAPSIQLQHYLEELTDPRTRKFRYPLVNILAISVCAVICGADDFVGPPINLSLGQVVTDEKSNEITAIPKLLEILEVEGALIMIDAMGCQTAIAEKIVEAKANYVLAVKGNQPTLHQGMIDFFADHLEDDFVRADVNRYETSGKGHGREEQRWYCVRPAPDELPDRRRWCGLHSIGVAISYARRNGKESYDMRYYILSKPLSGQQFAEAVRGHWGIENHLHWQLDVTFNEDHSRIRKGHADANFSLLRRTALSLLKNEASEKVGVKNKRLLAAWDDEYLGKVVIGE